METVDIAVIGGGGAGAMAYLRSVLNCDRTVLFLGDKATSRRGRAMWVGEVDNIPGMHDAKRPILGTVKSTLAWLEQQEPLREFGTTIKDVVTSLSRDGEQFLLNYGEGETVRSRNVILATGISPRTPPWWHGSTKWGSLPLRPPAFRCRAPCRRRRTIAIGIPMTRNPPTGPGSPMTPPEPHRPVRMERAPPPHQEPLGDLRPRAPPRLPARDVREGPVDRESGGPPRNMEWGVGGSGGS